MEVNIHEAKTHLSRLLDRVAIGEEVIIAKAGTPVAKLVPIKSSRPRFKLNSAKGKFVVPDDFNDPLPKRSRISSGEGSSRHPHTALGADAEIETISPNPLALALRRILVQCCRS